MSACSRTDRKSTRLNSRHVAISYAVFCLKKKTVGIVEAHFVWRAHRRCDTSRTGQRRSGRQVLRDLNEWRSRRARLVGLVFFFFDDTASTEIYTLSLHDALPIAPPFLRSRDRWRRRSCPGSLARRDRKSTRLNSSHVAISYAVFCLKKKKKQ